MLITKRFKFSYAHILPNHNGVCSRLHGHNAVLEVTVSSKELQTKSSSEGMVLDFGALKSLVSALIIDKWDHRFLAKGDEWIVEAARQWDESTHNELENWSVGYQIVNVGVRTTAEELSRLVSAKLASPIAEIGGHLHSVKFYETDDAWAETKEDSR